MSGTFSIYQISKVNQDRGSNKKSQKTQILKIINILC